MVRIGGWYLPPEPPDPPDPLDPPDTITFLVVVVVFGVVVVVDVVVVDGLLHRYIKILDTLDYLISVPHLLSVPTDKFRKIN